jgi:hypothetical protein
MTNSYTAKMTDMRSQMLDAEALLNFMRKPENLQNLLENDSPEVVIRALLDRAWELASDASGDCFALVDARDEDLGAELKRTALELITNGSSVQFNKEAPEEDQTDTVGAGISSREDLSFTGRTANQHKHMINWAPARAQEQLDQWNINLEMGLALVGEVRALHQVNEDDAYHAIKFAMNDVNWKVGGSGVESGFAEGIAALAIAGMRALNAGADPFQESDA